MTIDTGLAKANENQPFTTLDTVSVFVLAAICLIVTFAVLKRGFVDQRLERAQIQARRIGVQMVWGDLNRLDSADRSPASEVRVLPSQGEIGKDPWGRPFFYRLLLNSRGQQVAVVVSGGPDGVVDTGEASFKIGEDGGFISLKPYGDDIATIQTAVD